MDRISLEINPDDIAIEFEKALENMSKKFRELCIRKVGVSESEVNSLCRTLPGRLLRDKDILEFEYWNLNAPSYRIQKDESGNDEVVVSVDSLFVGFPEKANAEKLCSEHPNLAMFIAISHNLNPFVDQSMIAAHMIELVQPFAWRTCVAKLIANELEKGHLRFIQSIEKYYQRPPDESGFSFLYESKQYWPFKKLSEYSEQEFERDKDKILGVLNDWDLVELSKSPYSSVDLNNESVLGQENNLDDSLSP
ncbi:MAG: hypothetical protein D6732_02915 [Methanobacteriota archaeon]|nr:MAG: hypothetical protein D6732_02915 [Euryarchaeota archaeon]